ncbi:MAG TPA: hypothetical protein PKD55_00935 [Bellilinea sp.]|nr:hypothetical protein [Bellilinea sp.]
MPKHNSIYLEQMQPIIVKPLMAAAIGLNESIVIQQLHYWLQRSTNNREGRLWAYNTYAEWAEQFPFWSEKTIARIFRRLEEAGLILSRQFGAAQYNHTKWYTIDYDKLDATLEASGKLEHPSPAPPDDDNMWEIDEDNLGSSDEDNLSSSTYNREYTETTSSSDADDIFRVYEHITGRLVTGGYQPDELRDMESQFPIEWIRDAFGKAVNAGARNPIGYAWTCLNDWKLKGHPSAQPEYPGSGGLVYDEATGEFRV